MGILHELCRKYDIEPIKEYIFSYNFNSNKLNEKDIYGYTPFHCACKRGNINVVKLLISIAGFNSLNEKNNEGWTPFHWACFKGHLDIVELLISIDGFNSLNEKAKNETTPFHNACWCGNFDVVKLLISTDGFNSLNNRDINGNTALCYACRCGHIDVVEELLKHKNIVVDDNIYCFDVVPTQIKNKIKYFIDSYKIINNNTIIL